MRGSESERLDEIEKQLRGLQHLSPWVHQLEDRLLSVSVRMRAAETANEFLAKRLVALEQRGKLVDAADLEKQWEDKEDTDG